MIQNQTIALLASPFFAIPSLELAYEHFREHLVVITKPDKASGRGQKTQETPIKQKAKELSITCFCPQTQQDLLKQLNTIKPTLILVVAYGKMLSNDILDQWLCLNLHPSLLPKYRGPAPIQAALLNQDSKTGISIIQLTEKMDAGPIVFQKEIAIKDTDDAESLLETCAKLGAKHLIDVTKTYLNNPKKLCFNQQLESKASYSNLIKTNDATLLDSDSPSQKLAKIKAYYKKPGAFIWQKNKRIKILKAQLKNNTLQPILIQLEGKQPILYSDYVKGGNSLAL